MRIKKREDKHRHRKIDRQPVKQTDKQRVRHRQRRDDKSARKKSKPGSLNAEEVNFEEEEEEEKVKEEEK